MRLALPLILALSTLACGKTEATRAEDAKPTADEAQPDVSAGPTPHAKVCAHLIGLMDTGKIAEGLRARLPAQCEEELAVTHARIGDDAYETHASCVLGLTSITELGRCDPPEPPVDELDR